MNSCRPDFGCGSRPDECTRAAMASRGDLVRAWRGSVDASVRLRAHAEGELAAIEVGERLAELLALDKTELYALSVTRYDWLFK